MPASLERRLKMSEVRMCDIQRESNCYQLFSVKETGWQRVKSEVVETDDNGASTSKTVTLDACPNCSVTPVRRPNLRALTTTPEPERKTYDLRQVSEGQTRIV